MLVLILRLILDGRALFEIEETSQCIANDTYVTMGDSKAVLDELTLALPPLVSMIPNEKIYEWQERVEDLYRDCVAKGRMKVYLTFIAEFIHHPKFQADSYIEIYVRNVCKYISDQDPELIELVINAIESGARLEADADIIAENLSKDWQDSFVKNFKREANNFFEISQKGADDDVKDQNASAFKLALFESKQGVSVISKIFLNELLTGKQQVRCDAAYNIGLIAQYAPLENFKKEVVKMAGALIRIVNDKFDDEMKITIFRSLRYLFESAGVAMKPMSAALKSNQF